LEQGYDQVDLDPSDDSDGYTAEAVVDLWVFYFFFLSNGRFEKPKSE
jgi:hypothetical protein